MTDHPHRARRFVARGTLSVALVLALSGALFAANAKLAHGSGERHPQDLADLAMAEGAASSGSPPRSTACARTSSA